MPDVNRLCFFDKETAVSSRSNAVLFTEQLYVAVAHDIVFQSLRYGFAQNGRRVGFGKPQKCATSAAAGKFALFVLQHRDKPICQGFG